MRRQLLSHLAAGSAFFAVAWLAIVPANANPTGEKPHTPLAAHGTIEGSKEMVASLYSLYSEEEEFVIKTHADEDDLSGYSDAQYSKAAARVWKALRDAEHLQLMGEPAGYDLYRKFSTLSERIRGSANRFARSQRGRPAVQRILTKRQRSLPAVTKFLGLAEGALADGKLEIFEQQMEIKGRELEGDMVFFGLEEQKKYLYPFRGLLSQGDDKLRPQRRRQYMTEAQAVITKELQAIDQFTAEANRIRGEIAASGNATLAEGTTGGPVEAFTHVANMWGNAAAAVLRSTAIEWAFTNRHQTQSQQKAGELEKTAFAALASIVEASAASTSSEDAANVYSGLLKQISVVERRAGSRNFELAKVCEGSLAKLAARNPALPSQIEAYQRATAEPLRWRKSYASQQSRNLQEIFPDAAMVLAASTPVEKTIRPNFTNFDRVQSRPSTVAPDSLATPANWLAYEAAAKLMGHGVTVTKVLRLTPTSRTAVVPFYGRHYCNVSVPLPSENEAADMKTALLVDDTHGPLTIETADAVSSAEMHDYLNAGGQVSRVHLEALVTRFAALPDVAHTLVPLGQVPILNDTFPPVDHACWRLDLKPLWGHHRYFTVRVTPATPKVATR